MMNIKSAIRQMRVARRLGHSYALSQYEKIKAEFLAPPSAEWLELMALRNSIEAAILPKLEASRKADDLLNNPAERRKTFTMMEACLERAEFVSAKVEAPKLEGYEFTPEWWKAAELRERDARKMVNARN